ncbi:MAG: FmdB family zinc ribbon protein [Phycisphaerales bacterium JB054]
MPLYEYVCEADGTTIEAQRPIADADKPLADPEGKGRTFTRVFSTFMTGGSAAASVPLPTCCPCGKPGGGCSAN